MFDMEKFRTRLNVRMIYIAIFVIAAAAVYISGFLGAFDKFKPSGDFGDFLSGFQTGVFAALLGISVYQLGKIIGTLKDPDKLKKMYIEENDERKRAISEKAGCNLFMAVCYPILLAVLIAGYFSRTVFFTLLGTLIFIDITHCIMAVYYKRSM